MEQRQYFRIKMSNAEVYISDQAGFCTGTLRDFSRFGLCIADLPRRIHPKNGCFKAVVVDSKSTFKLLVEEKWKAKEGLSNVVGAVIDDVSWDWTEMVMQREPRNTDAPGTQQALHS